MATLTRNPSSSSITVPQSGSSSTAPASFSPQLPPYPPHPPPSHRVHFPPHPRPSIHAQMNQGAAGETSNSTSTNVIDLTTSSPPPPPQTRFPHLSFPGSTNTNAVAGPSRISSTTNGNELVLSDSDEEGAGGSNGAGRRRGRRIVPPPTSSNDDDDLVIVSERAAVNPVPSYYRAGAGSIGQNGQGLRRNPTRGQGPASPPPFIVPPNYPALSSHRPATRSTSNTQHRHMPDDRGDVESRRLAARLAAEEMGAGIGEDEYRRMQADAMRHHSRGGPGGGGRGGRGGGYGGYIMHRAGEPAAQEVDPLEQLFAMRDHPQPGGAQGGGGGGWANTFFGGRGGGGGYGRSLLGGFPFFGTLPLGLQGLYGGGGGGIPGGGTAYAAGGSGANGWGGAAKVRAASKKYGVKMSHPEPIAKGFSRDIVEPLDQDESQTVAKKAKTKKGKEKEEDVVIQEIEPVCASCFDTLRLGSEEKDGKVWALYCGHVICGKCLREVKARWVKVNEKNKGGWVLNVDDEEKEEEEKEEDEADRETNARFRVSKYKEKKRRQREKERWERRRQREEEDDFDSYVDSDSDEDGTFDSPGSSTRSAPRQSRKKTVSPQKGKSKSVIDDSVVDKEWMACPVASCEGKGNDYGDDGGWGRPFELYA
ncbi:hypothetical protein JCM16303_004222 [Sporobolomyces ruberrimus]